MYYVLRIAGAVTLCALGAATWLSIILARADHYFRRGDPASVARAVDLTPRNTEYLLLRALQIEYDGEDSTAILKRAASLNPLASAPRLRLGLAAEIRGDFDGAEKWLLDAVRVDRQFEPRWTLANFYFRRENMERFWKCVHAALEISYGDRRPAFELCWRMSTDPDEILRRAIPDRHDVLANYLVYLLESSRLKPAAPVAIKLAALNDADDLPLLYSACDSFIGGEQQAAVELWRELGHGIGNTEPSGVTNGDFARPIINHGFDWRMIQSPGVTHVVLTAPPALRISLSGKQAESVVLLSQALDLKPSKQYRLQWEARTQGIALPTGLEWRIANNRAPISSSENWRAADIVFTPADYSTLTLHYDRPIGQPRAEGSIEIRQVSVLESAK